MTDNQRIARETIRAVILGHAVADAVGVPVEFQSRGMLDRNPLTGMVGYGTYNLPAGSWSDDTSMTLCALDVLADGVVDYVRIMENFHSWYSKGAYTPGDDCFDIGGTCLQAIQSYAVFGTSPTECGLRGDNSNGNGSLMRILPFVLHAHYAGYTDEEMKTLVHEASSLTHAHERSLVGCGIYALLVRCILLHGRAGIGEGLRKVAALYAPESEITAYARIFFPDFANLPREVIRSSGYVVDSLEAAVWCLLTTDNYRDCVLKAANLGEDTDTVAAIAGGLAGALYGMEGIPMGWLDTLIRREFIEEMCDRAAKSWVN